MDASIGERLDRVGVLLAGALTTVGVVLLAAHSLSDPNVTWDEAGQYWMTQGQAFENAWGTSTGTLAAGLDLGRHGNILDPVGFTSLLWAWVTAFGSAPSTLRALPFVFFIGTLVAAYFLGRRVLTLGRTPVLVISSAVLTSYLALQWASEIRPYSIELMGVVTAAALTIAYVKTPSWRLMALLSAALLLFNVFSRYSFAFTAGTSLVVIAAFLWRSGKLAACWKQLAFGIGVLAATALFLAWNIGFFDSGDQLWVNYGAPIKVESITDFEHMAMLFRINFVYGYHKLTGLFIVLGLAAFTAIRLRRSSSKALVTGLRGSASRWLPTLAFVLIYEVACALASQLGFAQWNSEFRHSIGLLGIAILSGFGLIVLLEAALKAASVHLSADDSSAFGIAARSSGWAAAAIVLSLTAVTTTQSFADFRRTQIETLDQTIPSVAAAALADADPVDWLVDLQLWPSLRYLVQASGIPTNHLNFNSAEPFGIYGHSEAGLLENIQGIRACRPGRTTAVLTAGSAEQHREIFATLVKQFGQQGCTTEVVPLSDVESLLVVR
jgi:hypothetical protein